MTWQQLEERVRDIASLRWGCNAHTETIAGVKCDCVLRPTAEECILVEITKERNIDKVRADIAKLNTVRFAQMSNNILCRCYIVLEASPTDPMRSAGQDVYIKVVSFEEFQNEFFNYSNYVFQRSRWRFGSLINPLTGDPEENTYINVTYRDHYTGEDSQR